MADLDDDKAIERALELADRWSEGPSGVPIVKLARAVLALSRKLEDARWAGDTYRKAYRTAVLAKTDFSEFYFTEDTGYMELCHYWNPDSDNCCYVHQVDAGDTLKDLIDRATHHLCDKEEEDDGEPDTEDPQSAD
jgi:hypothetical protein